MNKYKSSCSPIASSVKEPTYQDVVTLLYLGSSSELIQKMQQTLLSKPEDKKYWKDKYTCNIFRATALPWNYTNCILSKCPFLVAALSSGSSDGRKQPWIQLCVPPMDLQAIYKEIVDPFSQSDSQCWFDILYSFAEKGIIIIQTVF